VGSSRSVNLPTAGATAPILPHITIPNLLPPDRWNKGSLLQRAAEPTIKEKLLVQEYNSYIDSINKWAALLRAGNHDHLRGQLLEYIAQDIVRALAISQKL
jgi:hypothetical protein